VRRKRSERNLGTRAQLTEMEKQDIDETHCILKIPADGSPEVKGRRGEALGEG